VSRSITKRYSNGEITVLWQPALCRHTGICFRGLPEVFDPRRRPWIVPEAASTAAIVAQVQRCPSGALSIVQPGDEPAPAEPEPNDPEST
jgi:uncharacterized Fe-S cluster protein YjdI